MHVLSMSLKEVAGALASVLSLLMGSCRPHRTRSLDATVLLDSLSGRGFIMRRRALPLGSQWRDRPLGHQKPSGLKPRRG